MSSRHKREWIRHLTTAKIANTQELALKKTNQHSLFRYMKPVNARPTANPGTKPPPHMHNRVHSRYRTQTGKTLARRQWLLQGIPRQPKHSLYAHHNREHTTRGTIGKSTGTLGSKSTGTLGKGTLRTYPPSRVPTEAHTDFQEKPEGGILVPMHPFPD
jgi:hypothetical protein